MRLTIFILLAVMLSGCSVLPKPKWPGWASFGNKGVENSSGTVAEARSGAQAVDRMAEIARREQEARRLLEEKYAKFREELAAAYALREKVDNENFDRISELNYGIYFATKDLTATDNRILIANLKSQANMNRLMPLTEDMKRQIEADIQLDVPKQSAEIQTKYEKVIADGIAGAKAYEDADKLVKEKEAEKVRIRAEERQVMAKVLAEQEAERARLKKEADDAVAIAKEKQRQEMVGWIVKALLGVAVLILIPGFLMKSPTMIVSGIGMLGLAFVAATIPFWIVATIMGLFVVVMVVVDPKTGKIAFMSKKQAAPPPPPAPSP
jgi:hypothetical protein